jgi:catechol-2,3-dioxygenase
LLFVKDIETTRSFFESHLGLEIAEEIGGSTVFLRVPESTNHHDLGLIVLEDAHPPSRPTTCPFHVAWEVSAVEELVDATRESHVSGCYSCASDHGMSLSLYAKDLKVTSSRSFGRFHEASGASGVRN